MHSPSFQSSPEQVEENFEPRDITQVLSTSWWRTIEMLHCPATGIELVQGVRPYEEPTSARELRIKEWNSRVESKCLELSSVNPHKRYESVPDEKGQLTLFEVVAGERLPRMWDGVTISTVDLPRRDKDGKFVIEVFPIQYSEWTSCTNPDYGAIYKAAGISLPNAGLGVSVLIESSDGFIPLTRRGIETPVYPGRFYSPGGGPKVGQSSIQALLEEILEETGLREGEHFEKEKLFMLAYVSDTKHQGTDFERPELIAHLPLSITLREVCAIREEYLARKKIPEADVWAYEIVSGDQSDMRGKVVLQGNEMCPPTEAALSHLIHFRNMRGKTNAEDAFEDTKKFMERVNSYSREEYHPPIKKFARY